MELQLPAVLWRSAASGERERERERGGEEEERRVGCTHTDTRTPKQLDWGLGGWLALLVSSSAFG